MKKIFAGLGIVLAVLLLMWGAPLMFPADAATSSVVVSGDMAPGTFTADGAATNVSIGWTPRSVVVTRVTTTLVQAYWMSGMAAASCWKFTDSSSAAAIISLPTTSCISTYAGSSTAGKGFTVGTDPDLNVTGNTVRWEARR